MENNEDKGKAPEEPKVTAPPSPPRKPSTSGKWIAVIIALLVVIGVLGGLLATHYAPAAPSGPSATLSSKVGAINQNGTYSTNITATGSFKNMTVYDGDGHSQLLNYSGSNTVKVVHHYA
ncbi:MAG TPA: hypothetical protein VJ944_05470, partial [Thermoplasmataceae archaeon]|nr:hypothetical protein [Thermoplasmataceae archaeon]